MSDKRKWKCLECGESFPMSHKAVMGEYPEDGDVFCSEGCRAANAAKGEEVDESAPAENPPVAAERPSREKLIAWAEDRIAYHAGYACKYPPKKADFCLSEAAMFRACAEALRQGQVDAKRLKELEAFLDKVLTKLPEAQAICRREGFVFDGRGERWEKLAFSFYCELVELTVAASRLKEATREAGKE